MRLGICCKGFSKKPSADVVGGFANALDCRLGELVGGRDGSTIKQKRKEFHGKKIYMLMQLGQAANICTMLGIYKALNKSNI